MRKRSIAFGLAAAGMALALASETALAGDRDRDFVNGAALGLGTLAVIQAFFGPPVVVHAPPPVVIVPPPPPVVLVPPPPVVVYRYGPPYGYAWGYWKHRRHHERHEMEWDD